MNSVNLLTPKVTAQHEHLFDQQASEVGLADYG
jgi:hypothetical protein